MRPHQGPGGAGGAPAADGPVAAQGPGYPPPPPPPSSSSQEFNPSQGNGQTLAWDAVPGGSSSRDDDGSGGGGGGGVGGAPLPPIAEEGVTGPLPPPPPPAEGIPASSGPERVDGSPGVGVAPPPSSSATDGLDPQEIEAFYAAQAEYGGDGGAGGGGPAAGDGERRSVRLGLKVWSICVLENCAALALVTYDVVTCERRRLFQDFLWNGVGGTVVLWRCGVLCLWQPEV